MLAKRRRLDDNLFLLLVFKITKIEIFGLYTYNQRPRSKSGNTRKLIGQERLRQRTIINIFVHNIKVVFGAFRKGHGMHLIWGYFSMKTYLMCRGFAYLFIKSQLACLSGKRHCKCRVVYSRQPMLTLKIFYSKRSPSTPHIWLRPRCLRKEVINIH